MGMNKSFFKVYGNTKFTASKTNMKFTRIHKIPLVHYKYINYYDYYIKNYRKDDRHVFKTINPHAI